jgi:hypothetical protein
VAMRRRRRVDLGTFEPPEPVPLSPVQRVIDEGVLISASTVRMAIKNRLIVAALRDRLDYDGEALAEAARREFGLLARENDDTADRLEQLREIEEANGEPEFAVGDVRATQHAAHRRRPRIHRALAAALREQAEDDARVADLVERARIDAWEEIGREITGQVREREFDARLDPDYERVRTIRIRRFVAEDLDRIVALARVTDAARAATAGPVTEDPATPPG